MQWGKCKNNIPLLPKLPLIPAINCFHSRDDFVLNRHGRTDGTALASVNIRHYPYSAPFKFGLFAYRADLNGGRFIQLISENEGGIVSALDFDHYLSPRHYPEHRRLRQAGAQKFAAMTLDNRLNLFDMLKIHIPVVDRCLDQDIRRHRRSSL